MGNETKKKEFVEPQIEEIEVKELDDVYAFGDMLNSAVEGVY